MGVQIFYNNQITVRRLKTSGSTESFQATATVWSHIRRMDLEKSQALDLHPDRAYRIYLDPSANVHEGDKLFWIETLQENDKTRQRTRRFNVKRVDVPKSWMVDYKEALCEEVFT